MVQSTLFYQPFEKLDDIGRAMRDIPAALKTLRVPDDHLVAYEVLFVVNPTPPVYLYWAFIRGTPVFEESDDAAAGG